MTDYTVKCLKCGKTYPKNRYITRCENGCESLLRTVYKKKKLDVNTENTGIWKYSEWLPIEKVDNKILESTSTFSMYISKKLARYLGLRNVIICLNIYKHGEKTGMRTGTFKDIEAELSFQRIFGTKDNGKPFVLSSDGNIATSFIHYSNILRYPIVISVTQEALTKRIWSFSKTNPYATIISLGKECDYYDAICLANDLGKQDEFILEGGTLNVARRDGVGTIMLESSHMLGHLPDHYFQALGSGPGAIAAYEASLRLLKDGTYGTKLPKIHGSQNHPFVPMHDAWKEKSHVIDERYTGEQAKELIKRVYAHVLTNRRPAYGIKGGVFDSLKATKGEFYSVTNGEAKKAQALFKKLEGYDIVPPAAVTVASLIKAAENGTIRKDDHILLNITGGGLDSMEKERFKVEPSIRFTKKGTGTKDIIEKMKPWKKK